MRVQGFWLRVKEVEFRVWGSGFRVAGAQLRVKSSGFASYEAGGLVRVARLLCTKWNVEIFSDMHIRHHTAI